MTLSCRFRTGPEKTKGTVWLMGLKWWLGVWAHRQPKSKAFGEFIL